MERKLEGNESIDLIAKYAKACDSIKSPLIPKLSINSIFYLNFFCIRSNKNLFFRPPPHTKILLSKIFNNIYIIIILAENSVKVAAPSSIDKPLTNDISKSLIS